MLIGIAAMGLCASQANAVLLTASSTEYIGKINDGIPSSEANETLYVNSLLDMAAGSAQTTCSVAPTEICDRIGSTLDVTGFADAVLAGASKTDTSSNTGINITGFAYLLAKYDAFQAGSLVWYVGGMTGLVDVQSKLNNKGISHYTLFNPGTTRVPEPGTLSLLAMALLGLAWMGRRRFGRA